MPTTESKKRATLAELPEVTFDEFSAATYEQWKEQAIISLKGGVFEKRLFTKTYEGIQLEPIYTMDHTEHLAHPRSLPGTGCFLRGAQAGGYIEKPWTIAQVCDEALPPKCNELLKHELAKGGTGINVALDTATLKGLDAAAVPAGEVGDRGVSLATLQDADETFAGINLAKYSIHMYAGASKVMMLGLISALAKAHGRPRQTLCGCIGADPIGYLAKNGNIPCSLDEMYDEMTHATAWAAENMPNMRTILVRGEVYHDGGANAIQEIAYAMSTAIAYIRALQFRGLHINTIARHIRFSFSLGSNFFMEIAKVRAARMVWAQIVEAFAGDQDAQKINIHARTSFFTKTVYDPYVNMLRTTTEAFSGVIGGIDSMQVAGFDEAIRPADEFSRRIARNIQIMLQNECNLMQPIDPAGGSWYIESLTNQVAEKIWGLLQKIEEQGSMVPALNQGFVQQSINQVLQQRFKNLASRADRAVGTNMYPNLAEQQLAVPERDPESIQALRMKAIQDYRAEMDAEYCQDRLKNLPDAANGQAGQLIDAIIHAFQAVQQ